MHSHARVHQAALSSVLAAVFLTSVKLIVGFQTHSLGILAEAAHSGVDLAAALITMWAVRFSSQPADDDHHYGHGKIENIAALIEAALLWVTCGWIVWEAVNRFMGKSHPEIEANIWGFSVIIISIVVDFFRSRELNKVAKEHGSPALAADALHFQSDIYSSFAVLLGLIGVTFGFHLMDSIAALGVAIWTFWVSIKLAKESVDQLMDKAPIGAEENVLQVLRSMQEVKLITSVQVRQSGSITFLNLTVGLDKNMSFAEAHSITENIESKIHDVYPKAIVAVHAEPI
jgi:cation diffusion facilitator family transporter